MVPIPRLTVAQFTRLWSQIQIAGPKDCWLWKGSGVVKGGRGQFYVDQVGRRLLVPRIVYRIAYDTDPKQLCVLHECDNPRCCNPAHLFLGTNDDNIADRVRKGRSARLRGALHGCAKLSAKDVLAIRKSPLPGIKLARRYGVTNTQISHIRLRQAWTHI